MAASDKLRVGIVGASASRLYARLAESIRNDKPASPGFAAAVTRHRLLDAIALASKTGQKQVL
jgi:predicted dehydrogenase